MHRAFAFDHERTARLEAERLAQGPSGRNGPVNATGQAVAFHALGGVYGIPPDVVDEFMGAKHTGYQGARVELDRQSGRRPGLRRSRMDARIRSGRDKSRVALTPSAPV